MEDKDFLKKLIDYEVTIDGKSEKPIVVMAPDGSDENSLRIYAFGGNIGRIPLSEKGKYQLADKKYSKYITFPKFSIEYKEGSHTYEFPNWLNQFPIKPEECKEELEKYIKKEKVEPLKCFDADSKEVLYLPLVLAASRNRFTCKSKENDGTKMERWKQDEIAKYYMEHSSEKGSIITDMEFDIPISDARKKAKVVRSNSKDMQNVKGASKPDFVIFDGERFGIVEFKYLGQSMVTHSSNSLDWHLLDFYDAFNDPDKSIELYNMCLNRLECLLECGVIFPNDLVKQKKIRKNMGKCREKVKPGRKVDLKELFWFGFLFVGGNKTTIRKLIENQLINPVLPQKCEGEKRHIEEEAAKTVTKLIEANDEIELYGHYCEDSDDIRDIPIDLKVKTIKDLHKELIESEKLEKKKKHK